MKYTFYVIVDVMMIFQQVGDCRIQITVFTFGQGYFFIIMDLVIPADWVDETKIFFFGVFQMVQQDISHYNGSGVNKGIPRNSFFYLQLY